MAAMVAATTTPVLCKEAAVVGLDTIRSPIAKGAFAGAGLGGEAYTSLL